MTASKITITKSRLAVIPVLAALFLLTGLQLNAQPARAEVAQECAAPGAGTVPTWQVNTAVDDQTPCSLRTLLTNAISGDTIIFDPAVFPPDNAAVISLRRALPQLVQGNITIDGSGAEVIIDGSILGIVPGLFIPSDGNEVRGLHIRGMNVGIVVSGDDNIIGYASPPEGVALPEAP